MFMLTTRSLFSLDLSSIKPPGFFQYGKRSSMVTTFHSLAVKRHRKHAKTCHRTPRHAAHTHGVGVSNNDLLISSQYEHQGCPNIQNSSQTNKKQTIVDQESLMNCFLSWTWVTICLINRLINPIEFFFCRPITTDFGRTICYSKMLRQAGHRGECRILSSNLMAIEAYLLREGERVVLCGHTGPTWSILSKSGWTTQLSILYCSLL